MAIKPALCSIEQSSSSTYSDPSQQTSVTIYDTLLHDTAPTTCMPHSAALEYLISTTRRDTQLHVGAYKTTWQNTWHVVQYRCRG